MLETHKIHLAYIIGVAVGDGNLSRPNGRATRLRVTCDRKYPNIIEEIQSALRILFPNNKVSIVAGPKDTYCNISVYSEKLNEYMPWTVNHGSKYTQKCHLPEWIFTKPEYIKAALRGLIQTDGSVYMDRTYLMVNFTSIIPELAQDTMTLMQKIGFFPTCSHTMQKSGKLKYTVRLAKDSEAFIQLLKLIKS